jgi:uncharacterized coiled-coil DUF342 family protein
VKGSPEIEDMAWSKKFNDAYDAKVDIERPIQSHVDNAEVKHITQENIKLKLRNNILRDELQTFSRELLACEKNANEYKDQASEWQDTANEWETKCRELASAAERWKEAVEVAVNLTQMLDECTIRNVRENIEELEAQLVGITEHINEAL